MEVFELATDHADEATTLLKTASGSFQVFARLIGGKTVTLNGITADTTIDEIHEKIRAKDGVPVEEKYLLCSGKPLRSGTTVSDYGIGKDATIHVNGRLRGGYGEHQAVKFTLDKGIQRGNNAQTIEDTGGKSRAHKDWGRHIARQDSFYQEVFRILRRLPDVNLTQDWWEKNQIHVRSLIQEVSGGGNCGDFAQIVHSQLVANTEGQHVYEVVMAGEWDHQLCLTYPSKVSKIAAMDATIATIADGWDNYMVIPLAKFLKGSNCYGANIKHLDACPDCGESSGSGCKTEEDKEKKCKGFLTIVAQQECDGGGGLPSSAKDAIGKLVSDLFEDWKSSDDYTEYVEKVKDDKRGIFRFRVATDVTDKRTEGDILEKLEKLRKSKAPTLKAELLDLDDEDLLAVFGDGATWRDLTLGIAEVKARIYAAMVGQGTAGFLQCINHLTDEQFLAFVDADGTHLAKVLATDYAALRYYGDLTRASDSDLATRLGALTDEQVIAFYDSGPDAQGRMLNSTTLRAKMIDIINTLDGSEQTRLIGTLGDHLADYFGSSPEARDVLMGDDSLRADTFKFIFAAGSDMPRYAAQLKAPHLVEFFLSSKKAAKALLDSTMKAPLYEAIDGLGAMGVPVLLKFPKSAFMEYANSTTERQQKIQQSKDLKDRFDALSQG